MVCPTGDFTPKCLFRAEKRISISSRKHISSFVANDRLFFSQTGKCMFKWRFYVQMSISSREWISSFNVGDLL